MDIDLAELKRRCDAVLPRATALATVVQFDPEEPEHRRGMARELLAELPAQAAAVSELIAEIERLRRIESAARNMIAQRGRHNAEVRGEE